MSETIKYLHIMTHHNSTHNGSIINMINDKCLPFQQSEHIFIMAKESSYEKFKHYENVIFNENILSSDMKEFNDFAKGSKYVFLHNNNLSYFQILRLKTNTLKKIIWCVWGEQYLYPSKVKAKGLYKKLRRSAGYILRYLTSNRIRKFYAIGIGFNYDAIAVRKRFGDIRILAAPYGYQKGKKKKYDEITSLSPKKYDQSSYKVMIGHSAYPRLQHFKILDMLYKFRNEDMLISLILSYGDMEYAKKVEEYALNLFPDKVEIINEYMSSDEYIKYLNSVDISILDYTEQAALGNFWSLLYLEKKLYLNDNGILKFCTRLEGIETFNVNDIERMNFNEFVAIPYNNKNSRNYGQFYIDENNYLKMWCNTLNELR
jgi:dTDP-N-acetylfucosamine:lipid II N-acetylfucosaminyltransferase